MQFETVIGLEVHVQLNLKSKLFAADGTVVGAEPNNQVGVITAALPGTLPKLNKAAVDHAIKLGLALNAKINKRSYFERKNYFYPDLPKGYQITQNAEPICLEGYVNLYLSEPERKIRLHHIHLEEDAGKSIHDKDENYSLIDLNRAGCALLEIVTEPDMRSPKEAMLFVQEIQKIVRFLNISNADMEKGSLRCDANISLRPAGQEELGAKVEIKNINSIRFLRKGLEFEIARQTNVLLEGGKIVQETRGYNAKNNTTFSQREKEMAHDYRYFPEPDLPPIVLNDEIINRIKESFPELPETRYKKYINRMGLSAYDAQLLSADPDTSEYFESLTSYHNDYKQCANWINGTLKAWQNKTGLDLKNCPVQPKKLAELLKFINEGKVNHSAAEQLIFPGLLEDTSTGIYDVAQRLSLLNKENDGRLDDWIEQVLNKFPYKVEAYKNGKKGLIGLFMSELMRLSNRTVDPKKAKEELTKKLET